ncbi:MAG: hypothetical protein EA427_14045 [Spirochaetaceae bacterium]|nr:MAG: hypothetical protein EA427_14045 [Spirochaetaceae bacterium]
MSIFRSSKNQRDLIISALLDGELSPAEGEHVQAAAQRDEAVRESIERLTRVRAALHQAVPGEDSRIAEAAERVRTHVERTIRVRPMHSPWWRTTIPLPVPLLSAAALLVIVLTGALTVMMIRPESPGPAEAPGLAAITAQDRRINVQVNVDAEHTDRLLQWLNEQGHTQQITVQLPEQAQFQLRGDPVLVRREPMHSEEFQIVPLEDEEE